MYQRVCPRSPYDSTEDAPPEDKQPRRDGQCGRMLPVLLLLGVGGFGVLACAGCAVVGYFLAPSPSPVVGQWELANPEMAGNRVIIDFRRNRTGSMQGRGIDVQFDYALSRDAPLMLEWTIRRSGKLTIHGPANIQITANGVTVVGAPQERFQVTVLADSLILANQNGAPRLTLRRVQ
jgi:hypothetical protein